MTPADYIEWMEDMDKAGNGDEIKTRDVMNVLSLIFQTLLALLLAAFCSEAQGLLLYFAVGWVQSGMHCLCVSCVRGAAHAGAFSLLQFLVVFNVCVCVCVCARARAFGSGLP